MAFFKTKTRKSSDYNSLSISSVSKLIRYRDFEWQRSLEAEKQVAATAIEQNERLKKFIENLYNDNVKWRFLYANYFLAPHTKRVLYWLSKVNSINESFYKSILKSSLSNEEELDRIINALKSLYFIKKQNGNLVITQIGKAYINYLITTNQIS